MTWEELIGKTRDAAELARRKTGDFLEVTKLKLALSDVEKQITTTMEGIGRLVYDARKSDEDVSDLLEQAFAAVDDLEKEANDIRAQICVYKNVKECAACHALNDEDAVYCAACGNKLDQ